MDVLLNPEFVFSAWLIFALIVLFFDQRIKRKIWASRGGNNLRIFQHRYKSFCEFNHRFNVLFYLDLFSTGKMHTVKNSVQKSLLIKLRITTLCFLVSFVLLLATIDILSVVGS